MNGLPPSVMFQHPKWTINKIIFSVFSSPTHVVSVYVYVYLCINVCIYLYQAEATLFDLLSKINNSPTLGRKNF